MTDFEVLIANISIIVGRVVASGIGVWALIYFAENLVKEGRRNPMKIGLSLAVIAIAGAGFKMIPNMLQAGENTGTQVGGGGSGYSMPSLGTLPSDTDNPDHDRAAFAPAAISATHQAPGILVPVSARDTALQAAV